MGTQEKIDTIIRDFKKENKDFEAIKDDLITIYSPLIGDDEAVFIAERLKSFFRQQGFNLVALGDPGNRSRNNQVIYSKQSPQGESMHALHFIWVHVEEVG